MGVGSDYLPLVQDQLLPKHTAHPLYQGQIHGWTRILCVRSSDHQEGPLLPGIHPLDDTDTRKPLQHLRPQTASKAHRRGHMIRALPSGHLVMLEEGQVHQPIWVLSGRLGQEQLLNLQCLWASSGLAPEPCTQNMLFALQPWLCACQPNEQRQQLTQTINCQLQQL